MPALVSVMLERVLDDPGRLFVHMVHERARPVQGQCVKLAYCHLRASHAERCDASAHGIRAKRFPEHRFCASLAPTSPVSVFVRCETSMSDEEKEYNPEEPPPTDAQEQEEPSGERVVVTQGVTYTLKHEETVKTNEEDEDVLHAVYDHALRPAPAPALRCARFCLFFLEFILLNA